MVQLASIESQSSLIKMKITEAQAKKMKNYVDRRVAILCSGKNNAYLNISMRNKIYRHAWNMLKNYFSVTNYHSILRKDYSTALKYINSIALPKELVNEVKRLSGKG